MKTIKIYQLEKTADNYLFMNFEFAQKHGFSISDYKLIYTCEREDDYTADDAFEEFNLHHPKNFRGHSLSVSDIVEINGSKFYCDSCGWVWV